MKRFLGVFGLIICLFTLANASSNNQYVQDIYETYAMPSKLHTALLDVPRLTLKKQQLKERGYDLSASEQDSLVMALQEVQGIKMVQVGFPTCRPCHYLFKLLDSEENGKCWLERWAEQGVEFYLLDSEKERHLWRAPNNLVSVWNIRSVPVLLLLKDGVPVVRLNGYNEGQAQEVLRILNQEINNLQ